MSGNDKCGKCDSGTIQHTSFMNDDGVSSTHVYGCNRCDNGWSEVENPPNTVQKEPQEDDKPGTKSFPITDPLLIQKLDSLSPEEMENLQKILVESMKELREKHSVKIGNGLDEPKELNHEPKDQNNTTDC
jgi:hypothetical protein